MKAFAQSQSHTQKQVSPTSLHSAAPRLTINKPRDGYEQEADRAAQRAMNLAGASPLVPSTERQALEHRPAPNPGSGGGTPLAPAVRDFMEPRFHFDFSHVRVHTDKEAAQVTRALNAQAFTHRNHIYFGAGKAPAQNALTAHELAHVVQQQEHPQQTPSIQRVLEVRPPGRGEGSSFERRQELIDRLNSQSPAIQYHLDGREIHYDILDAPSLTAFDRQMQGFIDRAELVPMRLTTGADRVNGGGGNFVNLIGDSFRAGNVDLDDILADDDFSFRSDLVHFLTERFSTRNYARRIGTNISDAEFQRGHSLGKQAEAALLQELFNDPSIQFNYEETRPNATWLNNFTSRDHHYQVFQVVRGTNRDISGGEMFVRTPDGQRVSMEDFRAQRAAAAPH